jgi:hypothetical protein
MLEDGKPREQEASVKSSMRRWGPRVCKCVLVFTFLITFEISDQVFESQVLGKSEQRV